MMKQQIKAPNTLQATLCSFDADRLFEHHHDSDASHFS